MHLYRKRPVIIQARKYEGEPEDLVAIYDWVRDGVGDAGIEMDRYTGDLLIRTLEGTMRCTYGDWVIKGVNNEFYPCKDDIFHKTYEKVEGQHDDNGIPDMVEEIRKMDKPMSSYEAMVNAIEQVEMRKKRTDGTE